jgi:hypothetical protein
MKPILKRAELAARRRANRVKNFQIEGSNGENESQSKWDIRGNPKLHEIIKELTNQLALDEKVGLPYGFSFDEFILRLRESLGKQEDGNYSLILRDIIRLMGYMSEREMLQFQKFVVIKRTRNEFMQAAKELLASKVAASILEVRAKEAGRDKLSDVQELEESRKLQVNVANVMAERSLKEKLNFLDNGTPIFRKTKNEYKKKEAENLIEFKDSEKLNFSSLPETGIEGGIDIPNSSYPEGYFSVDEYLMDEKTFEMSRFHDHIRGNYYVRRFGEENDSEEIFKFEGDENTKTQNNQNKIRPPESVFNLTVGKKVF